MVVLLKILMSKWLQKVPMKATHWVLKRWNTTRRFGAFLQCRCSKRCTVAPLYQRWSFHVAGFLAWDPVLQAASLVDERDERDLVDPVDSETSQVGFFGEYFVGPWNPSGGKKQRHGNIWTISTEWNQFILQDDISHISDLLVIFHHHCQEVAEGMAPNSSLASPFGTTIYTRFIKMSKWAVTKTLAICCMQRTILPK